MRKILVLFNLLLCCLCGNAQERKVPFNGRLTGFDGKAIKKARVYIKSPKRYVTCNKWGGFGFVDIDTKDTLKILIDKKNEYKVAINNRKSIVVLLNTATGEIVANEDQELIEKGFDYNVRRDRSSGGTIISGETLRRSGRNNLFQALAGRVPGLNISTDGNPGGDSEINIRGTKSLLLSSTPLFVVDGIITDNINDISLHDVDYVEILKEAHIYGSRGANGAILVFTKQ